MGDKTNIEWTDATWNPIRGCSRKSAGCGGPNGQGGCYAEKIAARFSGPGQPFEGLAHRVGGEARWTGVVKLIEEKLVEPLRWRRPRRIFVNSVSDLFHENLPDEEIDKIFAVMALAPQHTFQVLTKRADRMRSYFARMKDMAAEKRGFNVCAWADEQFGITDEQIEAIGRTPNGLPNVWLGVSVEDQASADERVPDLLVTPAAVRFLSCEPLIGPVDFRLFSDGRAGSALEEIDQVITGGESGPNARPMHPDWPRSIRDQCAAVGTAYFHKQNGEYVAYGASILPDRMGNYGLPAEPKSHHDFDDGERVFRVGKKAAGRLLDGVEHNDMPRGAL